MNTNYKPYINPAREAARRLRSEVRYEANQKAGICSDSIQDMNGLTDLEYCYFLRMGDFMPKEDDQSIDIMNGDPSIHAISQMTKNHENEGNDE